MPKSFTLVVPYYRNMGMLVRQIEEWRKYPANVKILVVDDGSPEPALPIINEALPEDHELRTRIRLYRITVDVPWNREGARNLAAQQATTDWILNVDIDHVLPAASVDPLLKFNCNPKTWYRFARWRVGKADETRRKDDIPDDCKFGRIKPHIDSHFMTTDLYWKNGGYDEDYVGCLGGGSAFLNRLAMISLPDMFPEEICLHVHTRDSIKDASDWALSRDTSRGKEITREKQRNNTATPINPIRFPWVREL